jgi:ferredoxin
VEYIVRRVTRGSLLFQWGSLNAQKWPNITAKKDMPEDAKAHWEETGKFDKYFSPTPGEGD